MVELTVVEEELRARFADIAAKRGKLKSIWEVKSRIITRVNNKPVEDDYNYRESTCGIHLAQIVLNQGPLEEDGEWSVLGLDAVGGLNWYIFEVEEDGLCAKFIRCEPVFPNVPGVSVQYLANMIILIDEYLDTVSSQAEEMARFRRDTSRKSQQGMRRVFKPHKPFIF